MDLHPDLIDLLTEFASFEVEYLVVGGWDFDDAWSRRVTITWAGTKVHVIGFEELCQAKLAAGRPRDLEDLKLLERFRR